MEINPVESSQPLELPKAALLGGAALLRAVALGMAARGGTAFAAQASPFASDVDVLNYALTLDHSHSCRAGSRRRFSTHRTGRRSSAQQHVAQHAALPRRILYRLTRLR